MTQRLLARILPEQSKAWIRRQIRARVLPKVVNASGIDLIAMAYHRAGILNYEDNRASGEYFVIHELLPQLLKDQPEPVFFDVGANIGKYTRELCQQYPTAAIFSFEPMANVFNELIESVKTLNATCLNMGLSDREMTAPIYTYGEGGPTSHTTLFADVISQLHHSSMVRSVEIRLTTADAFAAEQGLERIDFLKIDTEGNELRVLQGASSLLQKRGIRLIQFEFNEMNVVSRVFLKDFYQILPNHDFYRLMPEGLLPLGPYSPRNEIFAFQNVLAVDRDRYPQNQLRKFEQFVAR